MDRNNNMRTEVFNMLRENGHSSLKDYGTYWYCSSTGTAIYVYGGLKNYLDNILSEDKSISKDVPIDVYVHFNFLEKKITFGSDLPHESREYQIVEETLKIIRGAFSPQSNEVHNFMDYMTYVTDNYEYFNNLMTSFCSEILKFGSLIKRNQDFKFHKSLKSMPMMEVCEYFNRSMLKNIEKKLIPVGTRGRHKDDSKLKKSKLKKEYNSLLKSINNFLNEKENKSLVQGGETPSAKYQKIKDTKQLMNLLKSFPPLQNLETVFIVELNKRIKGWNMFQQSLKNTTKTKKTIQKEVEKHLGYKIYPINTDISIVKHILSIKHNRGFTAIEKLLNG